MASHPRDGTKGSSIETFSERRHASRAPLVVRVDYSSVEALFSEFTRNINEGGIFIETESPAPIDQMVSLQFQLPGGSEPIKVSGRVVWSTPGGDGEPPGMGVEFENLDPAARARVNELVQSLRSDRCG
jgi:uncharacterized protein (TIGR02266 family)